MDRKIITIRELAGMSLLVILLIVGLLVSRHMVQHQERIAGLLDDSAWMALSGQWSNARKTGEEARRQWEKQQGLRSVLADHTPMEEIDDLFAQMHISAAAGETADFARDCAALSSRIRAVGRAQKLSWQNIL